MEHKQRIEFLLDGRIPKVGQRVSMSVFFKKPVPTSSRPNVFVESVHMVGDIVEVGVVPPFGSNDPVWGPSYYQVGGKCGDTACNLVHTQENEFFCKSFLFQ